MKLEETALSILAERFVNSTNQCIFLTGKAGTGKTTFLKKLIKSTHKKVLLAAPTGIAAINAGGVTLHSLFQLPFGSFIPADLPAGDIPSDVSFSTPKSFLKSFHMHNNKRALIREMELLIIDEVSMLRADMLDAIDLVLRTVRRNKSQVFGGVQILFIGDLFQLPPVIKRSEYELLNRFYNSGFFFEALALQQVKLVYIEFEKVFRQSDKYFIDILNHFRENQFTTQDIAELNKYYKAELTEKDTKGVIHLTTHNYKADAINGDKLKNLKGKPFVYQAMIQGDFNESAYPVDKSLQLKTGAQVMFIKNDPSGKQQFFNGKIGQVAALTEDEIEVECEDSAQSIFVQRYTWQNKRYSINKSTGDIDEEVLGTFEHFPLKLAWAITVHKSQGLTFEKAIIDINDSFAQGQVYVALSRLTSLQGLILTKPIAINQLSLEPGIVQFSKNKQDSEGLEQTYDEARKEYAFHFVNQVFSMKPLADEWQSHINSYNKDESKSNKQKHRDWAVDLKAKILPLIEVADKFLIQVSRINHSAPDKKMEMLAIRTKSAVEYFKPLFAQLSAEIKEQIKQVKRETGTKTFVNELEALELIFKMQVQKLEKALLLIDSVMQNTELERRKPEAVPAEKEIKKPIVEKKEKAEKIPTKVITYQFFKEGLAPEEIAKERGITLGTVNKHLLEYVMQGELKAEQLVSSEKISKILELRTQFDTLYAKPIMESLEPDFCTYYEIRFVLEDYKLGLNNQKSEVS